MRNAHWLQKGNKLTNVQRILCHESEAHAAALVVDANAWVQHLALVEFAIVSRR